MVRNGDDKRTAIDAASGDGGTTGAADVGSATAPLSLADRRLIVEQAQLVLLEAYAHLPFKRALHAVDPVQRLRLLDYRLSQGREGDQTDAEFHREMIDVFTSLRDLHTTYVAPLAYQRAVVLLPFRVEQYFEVTETLVPRPIYVASKVDVASDTGFVEGVTITHWNGVPIHRAIGLLGERQAAGNRAAALARALDALTLRPMLSSMMPDEEWVTVTFVTAAGETAEQRFAWATRDAPEDLLGDHLKVALGIDAQTHAVSAVRKELYGRKNQAWTRAAERRGILSDGVALKAHHLETMMPWSFRAHVTDDDAFGYVRIFSFVTKKPVEFITEFGRLVEELPQTGLVVDVRGNAGGSIVAAEGVLQVLAKQPIRPVRAQFTSSPMMLEICERHPKATRSLPLELNVWVRSLSQAVTTGSPNSQGFPITPAATLETVTSRYPGAVVLIIDALCYSATDMFAAGFADHQVGPIIGTSDNTGAGGANVWLHSDLLRLVGEHTKLRELPSGIDFRVAVRRTTRVHDHEGEILEDLGIEIGRRYHMTRDDIFEGNRDLIVAAVETLQQHIASG